MVENSQKKSKDLIKKIEEIMKCEICKSKYDYNIHRPLIVKCGHTFCKNCIYSPRQKILNRNNNTKSKYIFICPFDKINHIFTSDKNEPNIYQNLIIEKILKEIMTINEPTIKEKYIVYSKPDMKRNKSPEISSKNTINSNERMTIKSKKEKNENINIKINSGNQIINVNAINVNIDTGEKNKNNYDNINKEKEKDNDSMLNDEMNTLQINEEMNIKDKKLNFEKDKINDDSIETIPYEEKSMTNMSFKDDFKELLNKNDEFKYQLTNNLNLKTDENNEIFPHSGFKKKFIHNINNTKNKQSMKAYNKKMLIYENNQPNNKINNNEIGTDRNNKKNIHEKNEELKELKNYKNMENKKNQIKNSVYRNKKIQNLNSYNNSNKNNNSLYEEETKDKDEKGSSSNNYYQRKVNNLLFDKTNQNEQNTNNNNYMSKPGTKSETKDIFRKANYYELNNAKKILNMKTIASYNSTNDKQNPTLSAQKSEKELDKHDINSNNSFDNNESDNEKRNKNYRKNRTVFRRKKKIIYDDNINENRMDNNTMNKFDDYKNENNQSLADLNEKEKNNQIKNYLFENSPINLDKKSMISKNIQFSNKNNISNSMNKSNSSQNKFYLNSNDITSGRKLDFENSNNDEIFNSGTNNVNNNFYSNNKVVKFSSLHKYKTINNSKSINNFNSKNISSNNDNYNNSIDGDNNSLLNFNNSNSNNLNNNINTDQNIMINSSYKKRSPLHTNNHNTPKKKDNTNQNIISIYIKMNNTNKGINSKKKIENKVEIDKTKQDSDNSSHTNKKIISDLNKNNNLDEYISEKNYSNTLRENNKSYRKNKKNSDDSIITKLTKKFESLFDKENTSINEEKYNKYKNYFSKMIISPYLSKMLQENPEKEIKITLLNNGEDLFIGFLDENNKYPIPNPLSGILFTKKGEYYEGTFVNGQREGQGKIIYKNGTIYEGALKQNKHHGFGKLTQLDGEIFIGEWKEGKIHGSGKRFHSNGDKYIGNYVNNIRSGKGHYTFANGDSYEGNWSNGKANGKGKFMFKNGNIYEGEFKNNIISGKGTYTTKNGDIYIGNFINGLINGKGTLIFKNGEKYIGEFKNGKKDGEGSLYDKEGNLINSGAWILDKFIN